MRGATSEDGKSLPALNIFQSTLLMRGATLDERIKEQVMEFQSTLLMRGATLYYFREVVYNALFQSTLLMRGATPSTSWIALKR